MERQGIFKILKFRKKFADRSRKNFRRISFNSPNIVSHNVLWIQNSHMIQISVLIGTKNRPQALIRCIESVLKQEYPFKEILVLDDYSEQENICSMIESYFQDPRLKCFRSNSSLGVAGGRNFLMKKASGEIYCVLDDDAFFANNQCLSSLTSIFENNDKTGIIAGKIIDYQGDTERLLVPFSKYWRKKNPEITETTQIVSYYLGGCHAIHHRVIEICGFYQDDLVFGAEELDLSYRAIDYGFSILYSPDMIAHHYPERSVLVQDKTNSVSELTYRVRNQIFIGYKYLPLIYLPIYFFNWSLFYTFNAIQKQTYKDIILGLKLALKDLQKIKRQPLKKPAIKYLKINYGRLFY